MSGSGVIEAEPWGLRPPTRARITARNHSQIGIIALTSWLQYRDVRRRAMDEHIDMVRKALERDLLAIEIVVFVVGSLDTLLDVTDAEFGNVGRYFGSGHQRPRGPAQVAVLPRLQLNPVRVASFLLRLRLQFGQHGLVEGLLHFAPTIQWTFAGQREHEAFRVLGIDIGSRVNDLA